MEVLRVIRGCALAYGLGVLGVWGLSGLEGGVPQGVLVYAVFGLFYAVPATLVALGVWGLLSWRQARVAWWTAPLVGAATGVVLGPAVGVGWIAASGAAGATFGTIFWCGAFGLSRERTMRVR